MSSRLLLYVLFSIAATGFSADFYGQIQIDLLQADHPDGKVTIRTAAESIDIALGLPTKKQAEPMIAEHFFNPNEFYRDWLLPSIARNNSGYADHNNGRGCIRTPMNFFVYLGLRTYGLPDARQIPAERSLALMTKQWRSARQVYENYDAETCKVGDVQCADVFYPRGAL